LRVTKKHLFFYGTAGKQGVFKVDHIKNEVSLLFAADNVGGIEVTQDGSKLVVFQLNGSIKVFSTATNTEIATLQGDFAPLATGAIRPIIRVTNKHVLRSNPETGEVEAFDLNTLASKFKFNLGGKPFSMSVAGAL
jgi:DNA-binding beta-propeller fold protein YncE